MGLCGCFCLCSSFFSLQLKPLKPSLSGVGQRWCKDAQGGCQERQVPCHARSTSEQHLCQPQFFIYNLISLELQFDFFFFIPAMLSWSWGNGVPRNVLPKAQDPNRQLHVCFKATEVKRGLLWKYCSYEGKAGFFSEYICSSFLSCKRWLEEDAEVGQISKKLSLEKWSGRRAKSSREQMTNWYSEESLEMVCTIPTVS